MTAFNWEYVSAHPLEFASISARVGMHAALLSAYRLMTPFKLHPTNFTTALKSLLLRIFFLHNYRFIYSTPSAAKRASRKIQGDGWWAWEVASGPHQSLSNKDVVMLYFHGGGFAIGEPLQYYETYRRWKLQAARQGLHLAIVALRYRGSFCH